jgi:hypothetical protein
MLDIPPLTDQERELLTITLEECAEVQKCITKIMRFGLESRHPDSEITNRNELSIEIGNLMHMLDLLRERCITDHYWIEYGVQHKIAKLKVFMVNSL